MRRTAVAASITFLFVLAAARPALAHGFGPTYDIPIPLWLYLYGAAAAVVLAFVPLALFSRKERDADAPYRYPCFDLFRDRFLRTLLTSRLLVGGLRLLSVMLFFLVVIAGLVGLQSGFNFVPTFVWVTWWVGLSFFTALVGNVWPLVNPWRIMFDWAEGLARRLGYRDGLELGEPYPEALGVWPAVGLYVGFVWVENVFSGSYVPRNIALFALAYTLVTLYGMAFFGKETWLRRGEVFSVFFGLLGRFAPTEVRVKNQNVCRGCDGCEAGGRCVDCYECFALAAPDERELNLRPPAIGLGLPERVPPGGATFVIVVLAGVTFDGLLQTPLWLEIVRLTPVTQTLGVILLPALIFCIYLGFVQLSRIFGGGRDFGRFAAAYAFSLVPIAIAYQMAHYYTYLLIQGQMIISLVSDPFGWGWDLFGTADFEPRYGIVGAGFVWYSQVALIVVGHVIAVYLAHSISLRLLRDPGRAFRSQIPMLVLMVLYTITSLWILAQPIVK
jgi:polyferredoxin